MKKRGAAGIALVGEPGYYGRFGFKAVTELTLEGVPPQYFLCLPLTGSIPHGAVKFHEAFGVS